MKILFITRQAINYNLIFWRVCSNVVAMEKKYHTYFSFVLVALGILHPMRMCHIIICGLLDSTKFLTLSHEWHDIKKVIARKRVF